MATDASLFSSLDTATKKNIYVENNFSLHIVDHGDVTCRHGWIVNVFHVPSLRKNLFLVSQLTHIDKIVELWIDHLFIKDLKKYRSIVKKVFLKTKD